MLDRVTSVMGVGPLLVRPILEASGAGVQTLARTGHGRFCRPAGQVERGLRVVPGPAILSLPRRDEGNGDLQLLCARLRRGPPEVPRCGPGFRSRARELWQSRGRTWRRGSHDRNGLAWSAPGRTNTDRDV